VWALTPWSDRLIVGGDFTAVGDTLLPANGIAAWYQAGQAPQITTPPTDAPLTCLGGAAMFTVVATGPGPLSYQWIKGSDPIYDDSRISGSDTPTLTITGVNSSDRGIYACIVSLTPDCSTKSAGADLPVTVGDFNCSGVISVQDIFDFLAAFFGMDPRADVNGSGLITVQDLFEFLQAFFTEG
jgi:hypothetical protein